VARQTHPPPSSGPTGRLPGLGGGSSRPPLWGDPRRGAALEAPTAPHATAPVGTTSKATGPARFWAGRRARLALNLALIASAVLHLWLSPWQLFSSAPDVDVHDVDDELVIPVDLLGDDEMVAEPAPPEEQEAPPEEPDPNAAGTKKPDAGPRVRDAGPPDAEALGEDAGIAAADVDGGDAEGDGGALVALEDAGTDDAGLLASGDAGADAGTTGPRDPGQMIGMAGLGSAGQVNVTLLVNVAVIRQNPVGARLGPVLQVIPQWNDFLRGSRATLDPMRDIDWILIWGPSLIHTDRDAVIVRYSAPDAVVDQAVDDIAKRYDKGGAYDVGVPGVKASLGHADNAERVFMRVQPNVLVIVPKDKAKEFARALKRKPIQPKVRPGEAMRLTVIDPWKQISIRGLRFSQSLKEMRMWIIPRADGGADIYAEGDTTDAAAATQIADDLTQVIKQYNQMAFLGLSVSMMTRRLLDGARVVPDGTQVKLHVSASQAQLEAVLGLVAAATGANVPPPPGGAPR
jgi:hypothetical protein